MAWLLPLACATVGLGALLLWMRRVQREIGPARASIERINGELRPALLRVTDATTRARRRLDG